MPLLQLHGPPLVTLAGRPARALSPREAALLAWLHLEGPAPRPLLAGRLWPDGGEARARTNLRQLLARLRRSAGSLLDESDGWLRLGPQVRVLPPADGRLLGPLEFDDLPELADWLARRREQDQRERLRRLLAAARAAAEAGDLDAALAEVEAALALEPALEEAHRLRMQWLYQRGDRAAAVAAWDDCRQALRQAFGIAPAAATAELGAFLLSGAAEAGAGAARPLPAALQHPPRLAGRAALLAELRPLLAAGAWLALTGPAGVGKTRLAEALLPDAAATLRVAARLGDAVDPGALLQRLVAAVGARHAPGHPLPSPDTGGPLRSPMAHRAWQAAVAGLFDAAVDAGLRQLWLEDLHHADEVSLSALLPLCGHWLQAGRAAPQLLATARADELPPAGAALLEALGRHGAVRLQAVPPLDRDGLLALLADTALQPALGLDDAGRAALADALARAVGGHPAHVLELLRQRWLAGSVGLDGEPGVAAPAGLVAALQQRLHRLPAEAQQLLQLAAVAGGDFDGALAAAALSRPLLALAPALQHLEQAQVFRGGRFSHDLVAQAAAGLVPPLLRAPLHRQVAAHLAQLGGRAARVAHHLAEAGDGRAAAPWWLRAADEARARWQQAEAAALYGRAAAALDGRADRAAALQAWCDAARCWLWAEQGAPAEAAVASARALALGPAEQAQVLAREAMLQLRRRAPDALVATARALVGALQAAGARLAPAERALALRMACIAVQHGGPREPVLALCEDAAPALRAAEPDAQAAWAAAYGGLLHWLGRPRDAAAVLQPAADALGHDGDPAARLAVLGQLMRVRHSLGELDAAIAAARAQQALLPLAEAGVVFECDLLQVLGNLLAARGQAAAGLACHDALADRLAAAGQPMREVFAVSRVHVELAAGRPAGAAAALASVPSGPGESGGALATCARAWAEARLRLAQGSSVAAVAQAVGGRLAAAVDHPDLPPGPALFGRVVLATLQPLPASQWAPLVEDLRRRGYRGLERLACQAAARAARDAGDAAGAWAWVQQALAVADAVDAWAEAPAQLWPLAAALADAAGRPDAAAALRARGGEALRSGLDP